MGGLYISVARAFWPGFVGFEWNLNRIAFGQQPAFAVCCTNCCITSRPGDRRGSLDT